MAGYRIRAHLWRTPDGRLVPTGHADATVLAYPAGTEMAESEACARGIIAALEEQGDKDAEPTQTAKPSPATRRPTGKE